MLLQTIDDFRDKVFNLEEANSQYGVSEMIPTLPECCWFVRLHWDAQILDAHSCCS